MLNTFSETQTQIAGTDVAGNVDQFIDANQAIDRAKRGTYAYDLFTWADRTEKEAAKQPARRGGAPALSKERLEYIRAAVCTSTPTQKGLSSRAWTVSALRDLIEKEYGIAVSNSTARNYTRKFGMAASRPLNRRKAEVVSRRSEVWLSEQFPVLKAKAKAANQNIVWLSCSPLESQNLGSSGSAIHAVSNRTGKASWLVAPDHNRIGVLGDLFDSIGAGNGEVPLIIFDESITSNFKREIEGFLHVKHEARKGGSGKTKKKVADYLSAKDWLQTSFLGKAEFFAVDVHDWSEAENKADIAEMLWKNEAAFAAWKNPNEEVAKVLISGLRTDLVGAQLKSYRFADAFGWMACEGYEPGQFNWCALILGLDKDRMRAAILMDVATKKDVDQQKREVAVRAHDEYAGVWHGRSYENLVSPD